MRIAALDFGSFSLKCLVADYNSSEIKYLANTRIITRLGANLSDTGELTNDAINLTLQAVKKLLDTTLSKTSPEIILAVGTEALRKARNSYILTEKLKQNYGIELRIISAKEEAELSWLGAVSGMENLTQRLIHFDSGGASTEISYGIADQILDSVSIPLGAVNLSKQYLQDDPPTQEELDNLKCAVLRGLDQIKPCEGALLGTGGGIVACAKVALGKNLSDPDSLQGTLLSKTELQHQFQLYTSMTLEKRKLIKGMEPDRADIIISASLLYHSLLSALGHDYLKVSTKGLRHGLIVKYLQTVH